MPFKIIKTSTKKMFRRRGQVHSMYDLLFVCTHIFYASLIGNEKVSAVMIELLQSIPDNCTDPCHKG